MKKKIIFIFLLALFFRFWKLTEFPIHLSMDEVAISVAAREVLNTGVDEWGSKSLLAFKSVGDYKPPVNIYLNIISILTFGFGEFATRFPVAFLGSLTAIIFALIAKDLKFKQWMFAGIFIAISPWHVHFSRASFGAITGVFFASLGLFYFLKWVGKKSKNKHIYFSLINFSLAVWAYHAQRVFVPVLFLSLIIIFRKYIFKKNLKRIFKKSAIILLFFAAPMIFLSATTPAISERAAATSFFRDPVFYDSLHHGEYENLTEAIFDNDIYITFRFWTGKYINYFDINYLFWNGAQFTPVNNPDIGLLYLANLPIIVLGLANVLKQKNTTKNLLLVLLFLGPLPATFSMNDQHPLRSLSWIMFFGLLIPIGVEELFRLNKKYKLLKAIYLVLIIFNIFYFKNIYTKQFPRLNSEAWQYGYEEVSKFACENIDNYDQIFVSESFGATEQFTSLPQYYLSYYCGEHPFVYTQSIDLSSEGIFIKRPLWDVDESNYKNALFIAAPWDFPEDLEEEKIIKKLQFLNGKESFWFVETK